MGVTGRRFAGFPKACQAKKKKKKMSRRGREPMSKRSGWSLTRTSQEQWVDRRF